MKIRDNRSAGEAWSIRHPGNHHAAPGAHPALAAQAERRDTFTREGTRRSPDAFTAALARRDRMDRTVDGIHEHLALAQASRNSRTAERHLRVAERLWSAERNRNSESLGRRVSIERDLRPIFDLARRHILILRADPANPWGGRER